LLEDESQTSLKDLAQWSDLVVFDYLTANLDRVVNNLYNMQWNDGMMDAPAHNLARQTATGLLVFLDNESGLLHGFRLLDKYEPYHRKLLDSLCVFRRSTVENLDRLGKEDDLSALFSRLVAKSHPDMADVFPALPEKYSRILAERIQNVLKHVRRCERIYETS
jgi:four-jointed box protein 1